jgi:N-acetylglucosaminyl-diphospho-decaprenol L-rhamnosyltransferase
VLPTLGSVATRLSAIIPTYNSGELLPRCLDALAAAPQIDDIVVLDGGSTDSAPERATERPGVRVLRLPGSLVASRFNVGMEQVRNELVLILDDDSYVDPGTPSRLVEALEQRPRLALLQPRLRYGDGREQKSGSHYKTLLNETLGSVGLMRLLRRIEPGALSPKDSGVEPATWVPLCGALVRRSAFQEIGGFDDRFRFYFDDQDFCRRLVEAGWEIAVCWDAGAVHLKGAATAVKDPTSWFGEYQANRFVYLRKHYPRAWLLFAVVWAVRAPLHAVGWWLRALARQARSDAEGARLARQWARVFSATALPPRAEP